MKRAHPAEFRCPRREPPRPLTARGGLDASVQLDSVVDKQQGHRMDLDRLTNELKTQHEKIGALALHIEGPPSLRHPALPPVSGPARVAGTPR